MTTEPIDVEGTLFLGNVIEGVADELGYHIYSVRRDSNFTWMQDDGDLPVIQADIKSAARFVFVEPKHVWTWSSLIKLVETSPRCQHVGSVFSLDFDEMYWEAQQGKSNIDNPIYHYYRDFTTVEEMVDWVIKEIIEDRFF